MVRIIAQGQFDVNEENECGEVFLVRTQGAWWFFLVGRATYLMSEDRSVNREPLYNNIRLLPCQAYPIHGERYMNGYDPLGRFVPGQCWQNF